jgi:hypothetical protein
MKLRDGVSIQPAKAIMATDDGVLMYFPTEMGNQPVVTDGHWLFFGPSLKTTAGKYTLNHVLPLQELVLAMTSKAGTAGVQGGWKRYRGGQISQGDTLEAPPFLDVFPNDSCLMAEVSRLDMQLHWRGDRTLLALRLTPMLHDGDVQQFFRGPSPRLEPLEEPLSQEQKDWLEGKLAGHGPCINAGVGLALLALGARIFCLVDPTVPLPTAESEVFTAAAHNCCVATQQNPLLVTSDNLNVVGLVMPTLE